MPFKVEPATPVTKFSRGFRVEPLTPKKLMGFDVTPITPTTNRTLAKKRKASHYTEPTFVRTTSGAFHVEELNENQKISVPGSTTDWQISVFNPKQKKRKTGGAGGSNTNAVPSFLQVDPTAVTNDFKKQKLYGDTSRRVAAKWKISELAIGRAKKSSK